MEEVLAAPSRFLQEKTDKMNDQLNNLVPYFRCSDEDIVKVRGVNDILHYFSQYSSALSPRVQILKNS